jgi:uncharacterized protein YbaA (DUF1428 family)
MSVYADGSWWIQPGALEVHKCAADDVKPGKRSSCPQALKRQPDKRVALPGIVFKSRRHRNAVHKTLMADRRARTTAPSSTAAEERS